MRAAAGEFLTLLGDHLEEALKGTRQATLLQQEFGGELLQQVLYEVDGVRRVSERKEAFLQIELPVKGHPSILRAFDSLLAGERLEGENAYQLDDTVDAASGRKVPGVKVDAQKRICLGKLPSTLILQLKRFELDYETMANLKLNTECAFPAVLDLGPYTKRGVEAQARAAGDSSAQNLLHGAVMFTTSKLFDILFTSFFARLHAQPYCHDFLQDLYSQRGQSATELPVCPTEANSAALFHYAIVWVVPIATVVKLFADRTQLLKLKFFEDLPTIINMLVGWAFGAAFTKHLHELEGGYAAELCLDDDMCNGFRLLYCTAVSLCCAFVITVVAPLSKDVEFGSGKLVDAIEELLEDFFAMMHRGATVTVMLIWYYAIQETGPRSQKITCSETDIRLHFFWACTASMMGSQLSRALEDREDEARECAKKEGRSLTAWQSGLILLSDLIQTILGFTAANSWLIFIRLVPPFKTYMTAAPTVTGMLENVGVGVFLFAMGLWYVWFTGESKWQMQGKFSQMAFTLSSMSFTLGNVWVNMSVKVYPRLAALLGPLPGFAATALVVYLVLGRMDQHFIKVFDCCTQPGEVIPSKDADTERRKKAQVALQLKRARKRVLTKVQAAGRLGGKTGTWSPGKSKAGGLGDVVAATRAPAAPALREPEIAM